MVGKRKSNFLPESMSGALISLTHRVLGVCIFVVALWAVFALIPAIGGVASVIVWSFYRLSSSDAALMAKYNNGEITKEECDQALSRKY